MSTDTPLTTEVQIITPAIYLNSSRQAYDLRRLTQRLYRFGYVNETGAGLCGRWGYGCDYESDLFALHHFCCWAGDREDCEWHTQKRWKTSGYKQHYFDPPQFWYKPTDLRINWYKSIGRDMELSRDVTEAEWREAIRQIMSSLTPQRSRFELRETYQENGWCTEAYQQAQQEWMSRMMRAMAELDRQLTPCAECSKPKNVMRGGGVWEWGIARTLKDENGVCHNCKTRTTEKQTARLVGKKERALEKMRKAWSESSSNSDVRDNPEVKQ